MDMHLEDEAALKAAKHRSDLEVKDWDRVRKTVHLQPVLTGMIVDAKVKSAMSEDTSHVITEVSSSNFMTEVPLWMQGNQQMAEMESVKKRFALRHHPLVLEALNGWWTTAQSSMKAGGGSGQRLSKDDYVEIFTKVFTVMVEDDFDPDEARASAEEDWAKDAKGGNSLRRCDFLDSLFELADVWTEEIDAQEYADFLDLTRRTVSDRFPEGSRWKRIVRPGGFHFELAKVVAIAEKKAEEEERARKMEGLRQKKEARVRVAPVLRLPIVHTVGSWPHKRRTRPLVLHPWQSCGFSRCPAGGRKAAEKAGAPGEQSSCQGPGSSSWSRRAKKDQGGKEGCHGDTSPREGQQDTDRAAQRDRQSRADKSGQKQLRRQRAVSTTADYSR